MRTTIKDIARMSDVSTATVSLILNGKNVRVSNETKEKVLNKVKECGYTPNVNAVGLATKRTNTVGLIIPDISNLFFSHVAKSLEKNLNSKGYRLIVCNTDDNVEEENQYLKILLASVDALVICRAPSGDLQSELSLLNGDNNVPIVAFDRFDGTMNCPVVATDNRNSAKEVIKHIIDLGHTKIACITGPSDGFSSASRFEGYKDALADAGIPFDPKLVEMGDYRFESGYECTLKLLKEKPTALFACNDMMAYGAYKAIEKEGLRIPQDISVIGFDDLMFSSMMSVPLTSVKQDVVGMCDKMCEIIYDSFAGKIVDNEVSLFKATPSYRDSVSAIKK